VNITGHTVEKPEKFEEVCGSMAQTFLTSFGIWAMSLGSKMKNLDALGAYQSRKEKEHVVSALTFMRRPALHWASTYNAKITAREEIFQDLPRSQFSRDKLGCLQDQVQGLLDDYH
jgi:hypothetical protein